jgi:hypothetical protein
MDKLKAVWSYVAWLYSCAVMWIGAFPHVAFWVIVGLAIAALV